jgi:hypothetical protein
VGVVNKPSRHQITIRVHPQARCEICPTPQGRGDYLTAEDGANVLVLAPPGVRIPTEYGDPVPLSADGWRLAVFVPRDGETPLLDQHRPHSVFDVGVRGALMEILLRCPEQLGWFAESLEQMIRAVWMISQPDLNGDVPALAAKRAQERDEILEELVPALEECQNALTVTDERLADPYFLIGLRDELEAAAPR